MVYFLLPLLNIFVEGFTIAKYTQDTLHYRLQTWAITLQDCVWDSFLRTLSLRENWINYWEQFVVESGVRRNRNIVSMEKKVRHHSVEKICLYRRQLELCQWSVHIIFTGLCSALISLIHLYTTIHPSIFWGENPQNWAPLKAAVRDHQEKYLANLLVAPMLWEILQSFISLFLHCPPMGWTCTCALQKIICEPFICA